MTSLAVKLDTVVEFAHNQRLQEELFTSGQSDSDDHAVTPTNQEAGTITGQWHFVIRWILVLNPVETR